MDWFLLTAISVIFRAVYGVLTKVLSNKVETSTYTQGFLLPLAAGVIALLVSPLLGGWQVDFAKVNLVVVALVIVGQGLGNIFYFAAIKNLTSGTAQITFSSILVFNTVLSLVFLGLKLSFINIFGLVLLMLAILSVTSGKIEFHPRGVLLMILSALLFSVFQLSSAELSKQMGVTTYLLMAYFGAATLIFIVKRKVIISDFLKTRNLKSTFGVPLVTAIPSLGNFVFAYWAYRIAPEPGKVAMLLTSQVVLAVFLSYFFLNEKGHLLRKIVAAILVVVSAVLIKY